MKRALVIFFLSLMVVQAAHANVNQLQTRRERPAVKDLYARTHEAFLKEDFVSCERLSAEYLASNKNFSEESWDILYLRGLSLVKLNRGDEARGIFMRFKAAPSDMKQDVAVSVADSYFNEGRLKEAYQSYETALQKYPDNQGISHLRGRVNQLSARLAAHAAPRTALKEFDVEHGGIFSVQVGAFSREKNAEKIIRKLSENSFDAYLQKTPKAYRVRIGRGLSRDEAEALEKRLREQGYPAKVV